eukprot:1140433-Pelagomonas_calceolata.AAC.2
MEDVAAEAAAGSVGKAVQAGEAGIEKLSAIAPEEFVGPTATAPSEGKERGAGERGSGTREQAAARSQGGVGRQGRVSQWRCLRTQQSPQMK